MEEINNKDINIKISDVYKDNYSKNLSYSFTARYKEIKVSGNVIDGNVVDMGIKIDKEMNLKECKEKVAEGEAVAKKVIELLP